MNQRKAIGKLLLLSTLLLCLAARAAGRASLAALEEAARLSLAAGDEAEAARALNRAGRLRLALNEPRAALDAHRGALRHLRRAPDAAAQADALNGLGEAHLVLQ